MTEQLFPLNEKNIDVSADTIVAFCSQHKIDRKETIRVRLMCEECFRFSFF